MVQGCSRRSSFWRRGVTCSTFFISSTPAIFSASRSASLFTSPSCWSQSSRPTFLLQTSAYCFRPPPYSQTNTPPPSSSTRSSTHFHPLALKSAPSTFACTLSFARLTCGRRFNSLQMMDALSRMTGAICTLTSPQYQVLTIVFIRFLQGFS